MTATLPRVQTPRHPVVRGRCADDSLSLYAHIPFCSTRCSYCAFNTYTGLDALIEPFVQAMCREIDVVARSAAGQVTPAHTLYFGGGTPSLLEPAQIAAIVEACQMHFGLLPDSEVTLEVNPGSVDFAKMAAFREAGVNRISLGVQSAHAAELEMYRRSHSFEDAADAFKLARAAGIDNVSVDLIYGAPGQTRESWRDSLQTVLTWQPDHVSLYSLTLEPQTLLERQVTNGTLPAPDPDLAADMYDDARATCAHAGLRQYEISNWARPGLESRHNRQYWLNKPFLGFGPGAHGAAGGVRIWNVKPVHEYISRIRQGNAQPFPFSPALADYEEINEELAMAETMILGLRLVHEGLDCGDFERRFGKSPLTVYARQIAALERLGLLEVDGPTLRLKERAYLISNRVFVEFMPDAE